MDMDLFQPDEIPLQEGERTLTCSCPKCSAKIELDFAQISEDTTTNNCPAGETLTVLNTAHHAKLFIPIITQQNSPMQQKNALVKIVIFSEV